MGLGNFLKQENMFSGNTNKKIPKDFKDCYKTDNVTNNLWIWCERIERWGFRICIALLIIGLITIISNAVETAQLLEQYGLDLDELREFSIDYGVEVKSVFETVIEDTTTWALYCFLEYCAYHTLALLVGSLATIVQNTKITANVSLYKYAIENNILFENDDAEKEADKTENNTTAKNTSSQKQEYNPLYESESKVCPNCGKSQPAYRSLCFYCRSKFIDNNTWVCPECCRENSNDITECKCGYKK